MYSVHTFLKIILDPNAFVKHSFCVVQYFHSQSITKHSLVKLKKKSEFLELVSYNARTAASVYFLKNGSCLCHHKRFKYMLVVHFTTGSFYVLTNISDKLQFPCFEKFFWIQS